MITLTPAITFEFALAISTSSRSDLLSWSSLLCICLFANDSRTQDLRSLYHEHTSSSLNHVSRCSWYQQAKRAQESYHLRKHELRMKSKIKQKAKKLLKQENEIRIAAKRAEEYTCRRCKHSIRFDSNIKLHEHIRTRHAKKSKSAQQSVESVFSPSTSPVSSSQSIISSLSTSPKLIVKSLATSSEFSFEIASESSSIATSRKPISWAEIVSRPVASKLSRLSIATSKSVCKSLENASIACSSTPSRTPSSKPQGIQNQKPYLTVNDLYRMFAEKSSPFDLQSRQNKSLSLQNSDKCSSRSSEPIQSRITSYFNATVSSASKSAKFEAFGPTHAREILSRQSSASVSSTSFPLRFSKVSHPSPVCRHCQERFAIYWPISWVMSTASRVGNAEILMKIRFSSRFARSRPTLGEYWPLLEEVTTLRKLACCLFVCFIRSLFLLLIVYLVILWESIDLRELKVICFIVSLIVETYLCCFVLI